MREGVGQVLTAMMKLPRCRRRSLSGRARPDVGQRPGFAAREHGVKVEMIAPHSAIRKHPNGERQLPDRRASFLRASLPVSLPA
jgi:hypothetical protein